MKYDRKCACGCGRRVLRGGTYVAHKRKVQRPRRRRDARYYSRACQQRAYRARWGCR